MNTKKQPSDKPIIPTEMHLEATESPNTPVPQTQKNYFEFRLRIRYWWLWTALVAVFVMYPVAFIYTAFSMQFNERNGSYTTFQKQWEETGCPAILAEQAKAGRLDDWRGKQRWKHLLLLDDSYLASNNQEILKVPLCLGAGVVHLYQTPGPWRYDIVDTETQKIIISITKGE